MELKELANENGLDDKIRVTEITKMPDVLQLKIQDDESDIIKQILNENAGEE